MRNNVQFLLSIDRETTAELDRLARAEHRDIKGEISALISEGLLKHGYPPPNDVANVIAAIQLELDKAGDDAC